MTYRPAVQRAAWYFTLLLVVPLAVGTIDNQHRCLSGDYLACSAGFFVINRLSLLAFLAVAVGCVVAEVRRLLRDRDRF